MRLRRALLGIFIAVCGVMLGSSAFAQSDNNPPAPQPINPLTGPSFPCPQPADPLAQLICTTPQLALLDMQFVQAYKALYQQVGADGDPALRHEDYEFDLAVRSQCNISISQGATQSPTPPPPAPAGAAQCVIPLYQQQIATWKAQLQGPALEEANRSIQDQLKLQSRLQALGFLPARAQIDGVFGTGTRTAIIQWQNSVGREPTGLLGDADAQALLADVPQSASTPSTTPIESPSPTPTTPTQSNASVQAAWAPYAQYGACMLSNGFQLPTFIQDGILPTDAIAASALNKCIETWTPQPVQISPSQPALPVQTASPPPSTAPNAEVSQNSALEASRSNGSRTDQNSNTLALATPSTSGWTAFLYKNSVCALSAPDGKVTIMNDGRPEYAVLIIGVNAAQNTPSSLQFGDKTELPLATLDSSGGWLESRDAAAYDLDAKRDADLENNLKNFSDSQSLLITVGETSFTENLTGAAIAVGHFDDCVDEMTQGAQVNGNTSNSTSSEDQNQAPTQDNSNTQSQSDQTYTVTIQCVESDNTSDGGYSNAGYTCMEPGNGDMDLSDGGSVLITDATGNHNFGAFDFVKSVNSGNNAIQLPLTPPFEVKAQAGGMAEPFQLDVQIQNASGKVVYDNKTVQAFGVIDVTNSDLSN